MPDYDAGTASVRIRPRMDRFQEDLEAELEKIRTRATVQVEADTDSAAGDLDRFRVEQEARPVKVRVEADRSGFDQVKKDLSDLGDSAGGLLKLGVVFSGIGELPAAATAVAALTGVLEQLAGAGAAVPGVLGGVVASVGTVKLGLDGVADAYKALDKAADGSAKNVKAANDALAKLAPDAADAVRAAHDVADQLKDALVKPIQSNLFQGISGDLHTLTDSLLPNLKTGLGGISTALNGDIRELFASVGSDSTKGLLDRILGNTSDAETRFRKAIDPIIHGIGTISAAGSDVLPRLADDLGNVAQKFDDFISGADKDGTLAKFINDGITGVEQLGSTFVNVGKIINDITQAAGGGQGLLGTLEDGTKKLDAFLKTPAGQQDLKNFFEEGKKDIGELIDVAKSLPDILAGIFHAGQDAAHTFLPVLKEVLDDINDIPGGAQTVADAFLAWKFVGVIKDVSTAVTGITTALGGIGGAAADAGAAGVAGLNPLLTAIAAATAGIPVLFSAITPTPAPVRQPGETLDAFLDRTQKQGTYDPVTGAPVALAPGQAPVAKPGPPRTDTGDLLGAPPAALPPAPPDPRQIAGPVPGPSNPLAPGGALGGQPFIGPRPPSRAMGGPSPSGHPNGPTGGYITELHSDEWVLPKHARKAIGDKALWALTEGRSFAPGGYIDPNGNPITPGALPGPATGIADTGTGTPSGSGIFGSLLSGLGLNIPGIGNTGAPASDTAAKVTPGLAGLFQAGSDPNKLSQWGTQTGDWLGQFAGKTLLSLGTTLWQGALGIFGLQDSIISPSNQYVQAAAKAAGFYLGDDGPLGSGQSGKSRTTKAPTDKELREGQQKIQRADQRVAEVQQRIDELKPDTKQSERLSLQNDLTNAQQDAADARSDFSALGAVDEGGVISTGGVAPSGFQYNGRAADANVAWQKYLAAGLPQSEWGDFVKLENSEAGFNPAAKNPSSTAYGVGQFLDSTWASVGGTKTSDPGQQFALMMEYLKQRYHGSPSAAWQFHLANNWYDDGFYGGPVPQGISLVTNQTGQNEHMMILTEQQRQKVAALLDPAKPNFQTPDAKTLQPRPPTVPARHLPAVATPQPIPAQPPLEAPPTPAPNASQQGSGQTSTPAPVIGAAPSSEDHELPALKTGITSAAQTAGNLASSALSAAGGAGGFGGAAAGQFVSGLIQEGGKVANDVANVFSSLGVGSIDHLGSTDRAYGYTAIAQQQQPDTLPYGGAAGPRTVIGGIYGHNTDDVFRQLEVKESQDRQGFYATR